MSVYGGFATRQQERFYSKLLEKLITLMQTKILSTFTECKHCKLTHFREGPF